MRQYKPEEKQITGFTLIELLVVIGVIGILASILLPSLAKSKGLAYRSACLSNLRQQYTAWQLYLDDNTERFPDRRDLKTALPGGYKPWNSWPTSDPRSGWAIVVLSDYLKEKKVWVCPALERKLFPELPQISQRAGFETDAPVSKYWMWRFDRKDDPVPADNFWGRTVEDCVISLRTAGNQNAPSPASTSDVELTVDVYFPATVASLQSDIKGRTAHYGGRNRLMLDGNARFFKDKRTPFE